jgi:hypothetical protein
MKHFKDENNAIYAFELDGSQDAFIKPNMTLLSDDELAILRAPTPEQLALETASKAQSALDEIDLKSIRAIREFVASLPDAPKQVKELEADADAERAKLSE